MIYLYVSAFLFVFVLVARAISGNKEKKTDPLLDVVEWLGEVIRDGGRFALIAAVVAFGLCGVVVYELASPPSDRGSASTQTGSAGAPNSQASIPCPAANTAASDRSGAQISSPVRASFRDCADVCPEMVSLPSGSFIMGSPDSETCPLGLTGIEHPQHRVWISYPLAVGKYPVTHDEYAAFVAATGHPDADACYSATAADTALFDEVAGRNWHNTGFNQTGRDPVVCVDWDDAQAYVQWMSNRTGHTYRLLSEAEYEYAARAGTKTAYYWGNEIGRGHANCDGCAGTWGNKQTSPVGSFAPNAFGLYDMLGNVWEWTQDCYNPDYTGAPTDGSAWQNGYFWQSGNCGRRIRRGGAWFGDPEILRSASRSDASTSERGVNVGFRIARTN